MGMTFMIAFFGVSTAKIAFAGLLLTPIAALAVIEIFR